MAEKDQKLVLAILEFLEKSIADGSVREDDKEGIEIASTSFVLLIIPPPNFGDASLLNVHRRSRFIKDGHCEPQSTLLNMLIYISTVQCIGEAFGVNPSDDTQKQKLSIKPATLQSLFDVYLKTKEKVTTFQVFIFSPRIKVSLFEFW
jgi:small glutamine-rich tetratricopeptide repeat-containing protein alpha